MVHMLALASGSPRRLELVRSLGMRADAFPADLDETVFDHLPPSQRTAALARHKVNAVQDSVPERYEWILGADTLIELPLNCFRDWSPSLKALGIDPTRSGLLRRSLVLGKAEQVEQARQMLRLLSGRWHLVHTGMALYDRAKRQMHSRISTSKVRIAALSELELSEYLATEEWKDVAGAYRIQGRAACFIPCIKGTYSGVMGLPIHEFYGMVRTSGFCLS